MKKIWLVFAIFFVAYLYASSDFSLPIARELYQRAQFEDSVQVLNMFIGEEPVEVDLLLGQNYFMLGDFKKSCEYFQKSIDKGLTADSYHGESNHWLGRAYGKRAEYSSFLTAPKYAIKAKEEFEKAAALCPKCFQVQMDLFEYYLEAPTALGGGRDKAAALVVKISAFDQVWGYQLSAKLSEKSGDYVMTEEYLQRALELSPDLWSNLSMVAFLWTRGRYDESEKFLAKAETIWATYPALIFLKAQIRMKSGHNVEAAELLTRYLKSNPLLDTVLFRYEARKMLKKLEK